MTKTATEKQDLVRIATWIDQDTMRQVRLRAAIDGRTIRSIIEESFNDWLVRNPVDGAALDDVLGRGDDS